MSCCRCDCLSAHYGTRAFPHTNRAGCDAPQAPGYARYCRLDYSADANNRTRNCTTPTESIIYLFFPPSP